MDPIVSQTATEPLAPPQENRSTIWGPVITLLWSVLIAVVSLIAQFFALVFYFVVLERAPDRMAAAEIARNLGFDGTFLSLCTISTLLMCVPLIMGIAKLKRGSNLRDYLGLRWPPLKEALRWSLITLGYCLVFEGIVLLLEPPTPEFMVKVYATASPLWLFGLAIIVAAPICEEIFFRGFMFRGLAASRLRWYGATIITAALWAVIHQQYNWFWIAFIFGGGLILGAARAKTNSTLLPIWLHFLVNALSMAETAFALMHE